MRGLAIGGCGWPPLSCSHRDEEEHHGCDPRPRSLSLEETQGDKPQGGGLDAASLPSPPESGTRSPQCRICFQGPEKVTFSDSDVSVDSCALMFFVCFFTILHLQINPKFLEPVDGVSHRKIYSKKKRVIIKQQSKLLMMKMNILTFGPSCKNIICI